jgi:hypothetical protein
MSPPELKHLLTTAEIWKDVLDAEKAKKRKMVRGTKARRQHKVQEMSSDEYESDWEGQEDMEVEILDSIKVELASHIFSPN